MKTVAINFYTFNELTQDAKVFAINEHTEFLNSFPSEYEDENGIMQTEYIEHTEDEVVESIIANDYMFFKNGELAHVVNYVGKHPKAGISEFKFKDEIYTL